METRDIHENDWIEFCDRFSREHLGWTATVKVLDETNGPQSIARELPLQGISFDQRGSRPSVVEISVGDSPAGHVSHFINLPLRIREADESDGSIDLQIEPARGPVTLLHVRAPVH